MILSQATLAEASALLQVGHWEDAYLRPPDVPFPYTNTLPVWVAAVLTSRAADGRPHAGPNPPIKCPTLHLPCDPKAPTATFRRNPLPYQGDPDPNFGLTTVPAEAFYLAICARLLDTPVSPYGLRTSQLNHYLSSDLRALPSFVPVARLPEIADQEMARSYPNRPYVNGLLGATRALTHIGYL